MSGLQDGIRRLSEQARRHLPGHIAHAHIADAAHALDLGLHDGSVRHLRAAADSLRPQSLARLGITDDESHAKAARLASDAVRHVLLVREEQPTDTDPPAGRPDRAAEGPATPVIRGSRQFAATGRAVELAARARREMGL